MIGPNVCSGCLRTLLGNEATYFCDKHEIKNQCQSCFWDHRFTGACSNKLDKIDIATDSAWERNEQLLHCNCK